MCDPISIGIGLAVAGTAVSAGTSIYGGIQQQKADNYNAAVADQNAKIAESNAALTLKAGQNEQEQQYRQIAALKGKQIASFAAMGLDPSFGSPSDIVGDTALLGEADAQRLRNNNTAQANSYLLQASNYQSEAVGDRSAGQTALVTGFLKAGSTALGGASSIFGGLGKAPSTKLDTVKTYSI